MNGCVGGKGRRILAAAGHPMLVVWTSDAQQVNALLVQASMIKSTLAEAGSFSAALVDSQGPIDSGPAGTGTRTPSGADSSLHQAPLDPAGRSARRRDSRNLGRRWIFGVGFALLVLLMGAVSYLVARTMGKELAVARLQTDSFPVSHNSAPRCLPSARSRNCSAATVGRPRGIASAATEILRGELAAAEAVEGSLDFARMEAGAAHYRLEPLAPEELVRSVIEEFRLQPAARGFDIALSAAPGLRTSAPTGKRLGAPCGTCWTTP